MIRRRLGVALSVVGLVVTMLTVAIPFSPKASAYGTPPFDPTCESSASGQFIDKAHIKVTINCSYTLQDGVTKIDLSKYGGIYYDNNTNDSGEDDGTYHWSFWLGGDKGSGSCDKNWGQELVFYDNPYTKDTPKGLLSLALSNGGSCVDVLLGAGKDGTNANINIPITNPTFNNPSTGLGNHVGDIGFVQLDGNTISTADNDPNYDNKTGGNKDETYSKGTVILNGKQTDGFVRLNGGKGNCHPVIVFDSAQPGTSFPVRATLYNQDEKGDGSCTVSTSGMKSIYVLSSDDYQNGTGNSGTPGTIDGSGAIDQDTCPINNTALRWIACPIESAANDFLKFLDAGILGQVTINADDLFSGGHSNNYYQAWNAFRILAVSFLVIAGLIMVISEALGLDLVNAYTIRKVLPRLLALAVVATLSWDFAKFFAYAANDITVWVRDFIASPFQSLSYSNGNAGTVGVSGVAVDDAVALWGLASLGFVGLLSLLATGIVFLLVGYLLLVLRQELIILLVLTSPFWIVAKALDATSPIFKIGKDTAIGLWLAGIFIEAVFTICNVFVVIMSQNAATRPFAFALYVGKDGFVLLILTSMRGLGGLALGRVANGAKGITGALSKQRAGIRKARGEAFKEGSLYQGKRWIPGSTALAGGVSKLGERYAVGAGNNFGFGRRGQAALSDAAATHAEAYANSARGKANRFKDLGNRALTFENENDARANMARTYAKLQDDGTYKDLSQDEVEAGIAQAKASGGWSEGKRVAAFNALVQSGTGIDDIGQGAKVGAMIAGRNSDLRQRLAGDLRTNSARGDISGAGYATVDNLMKEAVENGGNIASTHIRDAIVEAGESLNYSALQNMKPAGLKNIAIATNASLGDLQLQASAAARNGDSDGEQKALGRMAELVAHTQNIKDTGMYGSQKNVATAQQFLINQQTTVNATNEITNRTSEYVADGTKAQQVRDAQQAAAGMMPNPALAPPATVGAANPNEALRQTLEGRRVQPYRSGDPQNPLRGGGP